MRKDVPTKTKLPCFPCPHAATCCSYGTSVTALEHAQLVVQYPDAFRWDDAEDGWRTRVVEGRCVFLSRATCTIHGHPHYPAVCRCFPDTQPETGGRYEGDLTICPELARGAFPNG